MAHLASGLDQRRLWSSRVFGAFATLRQLLISLVGPCGFRPEVGQLRPPPKGSQIDHRAAAWVSVYGMLRYDTGLGSALASRRGPLTSCCGPSSRAAVRSSLSLATTGTPSSRRTCPTRLRRPWNVGGGLSVRQAVARQHEMGPHALRAGTCQVPYYAFAHPFFASNFRRAAHIEAYQAVLAQLVQENGYEDMGDRLLKRGRGWHRDSG